MAGSAGMGGGLIAPIMGSGYRSLQSDPQALPSGGGGSFALGTAGGGGGKGGVGGQVPSGGSGILPPNSITTQDMRNYGGYTGISSTEVDFLKKHGKPYSEMTPAEQRAVQGLPAMPTQGQYSPVAPQGGFNVNQAAAGALQSAMGGTGAAMRGPLAVGAFMNPYTSEVINRTQMDIMRQQQMAQNQLGAQATAARAFGGSRQGVAEGVLAGEYGRMAGDIAAQQRQAGYTQALDAAMRDRAARLGAASQLGALGQQAFGIGQTIQQQQAQQGLLQQGMQQALIDAARAQYAGYTGAPAAALQAPLAALGVTPVPQSTTTSSSPGLFNYLQAAAGMGFRPFG